ncbi:MAG: type II secretion system protein [Planctomycetota bacterium]
MASSSSESRHCGFTLIELIVVVILLGMVAAIAVLSIRRPIWQTSLQQTIARIEAADVAEREAAQRRGVPGRLSCDVNQGLLRFNASQRTVRIHSPVMLRGAKRWILDRWEPADFIPFESNGQSASYQIDLDWSSSAGTDPPMTVAVAGISGQFVVPDSTQR